MDRKRLLTDPDGAIAAAWGDPELCPDRADIVATVEALNTLKPELKQRQQEKQQCARAFGEAKRNGDDLAPLQQRMQTVSTALASLEQQRKELELRLDELLAPPAEPTLPARFQPYAKPGGAVAIDSIEDTDGALWDAYVDGHPRASLYHRYGWRAVIAASFGHQSFYWVAKDNHGGIVGVLPLIRLKSRLFGDFGVSMPYFNYGGPLADNDGIATQLLRHAATQVEALGLSHLEIRSLHQLDPWPARTDKVSMLLPLPDSPEQLDRQLGAKVRAQIKRARQENPEVAIGGIELLDEFYRVFAINMRDLGTPVYGRAFFRNILNAWPERSHLVVVRLAGKPVAAAFLLGDREVMEIPWASTLRSVNTLNINMLLYWEVLAFTIARGYRCFDFGRSSRDAGTFRFKKQWGAQPVPHYWHYWLPAGQPLPELNPNSPKFQIAIRCWRLLPVAVTRMLGPSIVQYLP